MNAVEEFKKVLSQGAFELENLESQKKAYQGDIDSLARNRESLLKERDATVAESKRVKEDLKTVRKNHDKFVEEENAKLNVKNQELAQRERVLVKDRNSFRKEELAFVAKQTEFLKEVEKYKATNLAKSEVFKSLLKGLE